MRLSTDSPFRQVGEKFINKVTASFIEDSYEEFAKKELQECRGTKGAQGLVRMGDLSYFFIVQKEADRNHAEFVWILVV